MKRRILILVTFFVGLILFGCSQGSDYVKKAEKYQLPQYENIYLGWLDLHEKDWLIHNYGSQEDFRLTITRLNAVFQNECQKKWLVGKSVVMSTGVENQNQPTQGLYIMFEDMVIEASTYYVYATVHFVDIESNQILFSLENQPFYGSAWGFENYLIAATQEMGALVHRMTFGKNAKY